VPEGEHERKGERKGRALKQGEVGIQQLYRSQKLKCTLLG
jgi:hypothetical protein